MKQRTASDCYCNHFFLNGGRCATWVFLGASAVALTSMHFYFFFFKLALMQVINIVVLVKKSFLTKAPRLIT